MATISIGNAGVASTVGNLVGNNAITSALGLSNFNDGVCGPSTFLTKFGSGTVFSSSSLPYNIRSTKNFTVNFHWFPKYSQIRSYFSNAFGASDTNEIGLFVRNVSVPDIANAGNEKLNARENAHFAGSIPGSGVNGVGSLEMTILATEFSLVDHCFYQWLRETESPYWIYPPFVPKYSEFNDEFSSIFGQFSYIDKRYEPVKFTDEFGEYYEEVPMERNDALGEGVNISKASDLIMLNSLSQSSPFTRADIEIKYFSSNFKELHSVVCYGAYPVRIETMDVDHEPTFKEGYKVEFAYDSIDIVSPFVADSANGLTNAVMGGASALANKVTVGGNQNGTAKWTPTLIDGMLDNYLNKSFLAKASNFVNSVSNKTGSKLTDTLNNTQKTLGVGNVLT